MRKTHKHVHALQQLFHRGAAGESTIVSHPDTTHRNARRNVRLINILFGSPYVVFILLSIYDVWVDASIREIDRTIIVTALLLFALIYLIGIAYAHFGGTRKLRAFEVSIIAALLVLEITIAVMTKDSSTVSLLVYLVFYCGFYLPRRFVLGVELALVVLCLSQWGLLSAWQGYVDISNLAVFSFSIVIAVFALMGLSRWQQANVAAEENQQLRLQTQREQISADLHDVLGQELTALAVKSELVTALLTSAHAQLVHNTAEASNDARISSDTAASGDTEIDVDAETIEMSETDRTVLLDPALARAAAEAADIAEIARRALADVRAVVAGTKQSTWSEALEDGENLLRAAGIELQIIHPELAESWATVSAQQKYAPALIREGISNVVHHAYHATLCQVEFSERGVSVTDNGRVRQSKFVQPTQLLQLEQSGGNGLIGLRRRVADVGTVTWGPNTNAAGWSVTLTIHGNINSNY